MKVYLVTSGEYSDYGVDAVFLDRQKAEMYCATRDARAKNDYSDLHYIEEWESDDDNVTGIANKLVYVWRADKRLDGSWHIDFYKHGLAGVALPKKREGAIFFSTRKKDMKLAEKVLHDRLAREAKE